MSTYFPADSFGPGEDIRPDSVEGEVKGENHNLYKLRYIYPENNLQIIENGVYSTYVRSTNTGRVELLAYTSAYGRNEGYGNDRWPILESAKSNQDAIGVKVMVGDDGSDQVTIFVGDGAGGFGDNSRVLAQSLAEELTELTATQINMAANTEVNEVDIAIRRAKVRAMEKYEYGAAAAAMAIAGVTVTPEGSVNVALINLGDVVGYKIPGTIDETESAVGSEAGLLTQIHRDVDSDGKQISNILSKCVVISVKSTVERLQAETKFSGFYKAETTLEQGDALFMATDGFWELMKLLATRENKSLQAYMAGIMAECANNDALAGRIDGILRVNFLEMQAYNRGRSEGKRLREPEWHPDNVGFVFIRHV